MITIDRLTRRSCHQGKSQRAAKSCSGARCGGDGGHLRRHTFRNDQVRHTIPPFSPCYLISNFEHASRTKLIDDAKRPQPRYRGLLHGTASIVREEGILGIYRGLFPVVSLQRSSFNNHAPP